MHGDDDDDDDGGVGAAGDSQFLFVECECEMKSDCVNSLQDLHTSQLRMDVTATVLCGVRLCGCAIVIL